MQAVLEQVAFLVFRQGSLMPQELLKFMTWILWCTNKLRGWWWWNVFWFIWCKLKVVNGFWRVVVVVSWFCVGGLIPNLVPSLGTVEVVVVVVQ